MSCLSRLSVAVLFSSMLVAPVMAETTLCTEVVPPAIINTPGVYCLFHDYALNLPVQSAIQVYANNVTIDFNGHRIGNLGAGNGNGSPGVYSYGGYQNLIVRNGTIRGFRSGVRIENGPASPSLGVMVEDMLIDQSIAEGIAVYGQGAIIRRNRVVATGVAATSVSTTVTGIHFEGSVGSVVDNHVFNTSSAAGIMAIEALGDGIEISGNRVIELSAASNAYEYGIYVQASSASGATIVSDNKIVDSAPPSAGAMYGIRATTGNTKIIGNTVTVGSGATAYSGGSIVSGTNN
jgi:hypothetical protein